MHLARGRRTPQKGCEAAPDATAARRASHPLFPSTSLVPHAAAAQSPAAMLTPASISSCSSWYTILCCCTRGFPAKAAETTSTLGHDEQGQRRLKSAQQQQGRGGERAARRGLCPRSWPGQRSNRCRPPHLKCVSASGAPVGFPVCPACLLLSLTMLSEVGSSAAVIFLCIDVAMGPEAAAALPPPDAAALDVMRLAATATRPSMRVVDTTLRWAIGERRATLCIQRRHKPLAFNRIAFSN